MSMQAPSTTGPDVVWNGDQWEAFTDGQHVGTFPNNQAAWQHARATAFAPVDPVATAIAELEAQQALIGQVTTGVVYSDDTKDDGVRLTHERTETCDVYRYGTADVWVSHDDPTEPINLGVGGSDNTTTWTNVRDVYLLLSQPRFQHLMGLAPTAPPIRIEPFICDDHIDTVRYGRQVGTEYHCGEGATEIEVYVSDDNRGEIEPSVYMLGYDAISLSEAYTLLDQLPDVMTNLEALLTSAEVKQVREQYQQERKKWEAIAAIVPESFPRTVRNTIINTLIACPDDPQAQSAALRAVVDRLSR